MQSQTTVRLRLSSIRKAPLQNTAGTEGVAQGWSQRAGCVGTCRYLPALRCTKQNQNRETVVDVDVEKSGIWTVLGDRNGAHAVENSLASSQKTKTERLRVLSSSTSEHRPGKF